LAQNLLAVRLRIIYRGLPLAFSDNEGCFCTSAAQGATISITASTRLSDTPKVKKGNNLLDLQSALLRLQMILSNLQHFHFQMENCFPLTTQEAETPQNQLLMFSTLSTSALPPFSLVYTLGPTPEFLAQLKWQVSSHYKERN